MLGMFFTVGNLGELVATFVWSAWNFLHVSTSTLTLNLWIVLVASSFVVSSIRHMYQQTLMMRRSSITRHVFLE
jgi:hypothetical protein